MQKQDILKGVQSFFVLILLSTLFPAQASARVVINEIAWMGGAVSSTDEWIELYNSDGGAVDLSGWHIIADDGSPTITLSGSISPNGYFLIERTDDDTVPTVTADLIAAFGNGLLNGGETLRLKNSTDVDIDVVVGGADWVNVGGDSVTKQTAQRTTNSWITGDGTPRVQNVAQGGEVLGESIVTSSTSTSVAVSIGSAGVSGGISKPSIYPRNSIVVEAGSDQRAFVDFPVRFSGSSTGLYNEPLPNATYRWNFGDGSVSANQFPVHVYDFPGEYVVTLEVFWSTYHERDRLSVVVSIPEVEITEVISGTKGYVRLTNQSLREMDISGWVLAAHGNTPTVFVFPPNSIILPKKSFILSNKASGIIEGTGAVALSFPSGLTAAMWEKPIAGDVSGRGIVAGANDVRPDVVVQPQARPRVQMAQPIAVQKGDTKSEPDLATSTAAAAVLWEKSGGATPVAGIFGGRWVFAFLASMLLLLAGVVIMRSRAGDPTLEDEYAIIEDIIEGVESQGKGV